MEIEPQQDKVPDWCGQWEHPEGRVSGCKGSDEFDGYELAREAWGELAEYADSGLTALAYLWRRFGPPASGSDSHKDLCRYILNTPMEGVYLALGLSGSPLAYAPAYLATDAIREAFRKPQADYWGAIDRWARANGHENYVILASDKSRADAYRRAREAVGPAPEYPDLTRWREIDGPVGDLNRAIFAAMRELLRPVFVRDVAVNILGTTDDIWDEPARPSRYAGFGVPLEAMDALLDRQAPPAAGGGRGR